MSAKESPQRSKSTSLVKLVLLILGGVLATATVFLFLYLRPPAFRTASSTFVIEPYLQIGNHQTPTQPVVVWAVLNDAKQPDRAKWSVRVSASETSLRPVSPPQAQDIDLKGLPPLRMYQAELGAQQPGKPASYDVLRNDTEVFKAEIKSVPGGTTQRFVVTGDMASGEQGQRDIAQAIYRARPQMILIPGDIVYPFGRLLEYLDHFFPIYNSDAVTNVSVPLLRSSIWAAAPGNHDTAIGNRFDVRDLDQFPDGLAYFILWKQPLNGPKLGNLNVASTEGSPQRKADFLKAAGANYPTMQNFSFDSGNVHWTMLDADPYSNWMTPDLRAWLDNDLKKASKQTWKFVVFHQADFNSDLYHYSEQYMRVIEDILQSNGVDVVFSGHVHNYQRTYPLKFTIVKQPNGDFISEYGNVSGHVVIDTRYDGITNTHPDGVIHIITGCGGAHLTGWEVVNHPDRWQPFTKKLISEYSFMQCDVSGNKASFSQIGTDGRALDHFEIQK